VDRSNQGGSYVSIIEYSQSVALFQLAREKQEKDHQVDVRINFFIMASEVNDRSFYEQLAAIESR